MSSVVIRDLAKVYPGKGGAGVVAVDAINLTVAPGEFMVLVGPSGCGKSTTLRMIAGLEDISGGTVEIGGRVVNDVPPKDRDIAMVFQNYALYPHMSVYENMAFGLKLRGFPRPEIERRVREAAVLLGIDHLLDRRPKALSGGQRQRVAVGRAIVRQPQVFLFDEPLSNLDAKMRASTRTEISKLHARLGATMIYVTHDQVEAMTMGDRICVMKDGRILQVAPPLELYNRPANLFVAGFIGSPPMNFFRGRLEHGSGVVRFVGDESGPAAFSIALPPSLAERTVNHVGRPVVLGVRPEDIQDALDGGPAHLEAAVELVEPMGAETHVHLTTGATPFIARVPPGHRYEPGERIKVAVDPGHIHVFDAETESAL